VVPPPVPIDTLTLPARIVRTLSKTAPAAFMLYALLRLDFGGDRHFNLISLNWRRGTTWRRNESPPRSWRWSGKA
jgi:hypothetical protein